MDRRWPAPWDLYLADEVDAWLNDLATSDRQSYEQVVSGIEVLAEVGPNLGRPLVDRIKGSRRHNLKELRPGSAFGSELRVLFPFDPSRSAILLVAGDKAGSWSAWYRRSIPRAEALYEQYLHERRNKEGGA